MTKQPFNEGDKVVTVRKVEHCAFEVGTVLHVVRVVNDGTPTNPRWCIYSRGNWFQASDLVAVQQ
jgi:hypothetical protein